MERSHPGHIQQKLNVDTNIYKYEFIMCLSRLHCRNRLLKKSYSEQCWAIEDVDKLAMKMLLQMGNSLWIIQSIQHSGVGGIHSRDIRKFLPLPELSLMLEWSCRDSLVGFIHCAQTGSNCGLLNKQMDLHTMLRQK